MSKSVIRDNRSRGTVGEFLNNYIQKNSELSIVSAYFTIYAYYQLKDKLDSIKELNFLFGEPTFLKSLDPAKVNKKDFKIENEKMVIPLESRLSQKSVAKECSDWIISKVNIKSMVKPNFLHGKMYHIKNPNDTEKAIVGSSNFTVQGLGLSKVPNIELNLIMSDERDTEELKLWFNELWTADKDVIEDVKEEVLKYLALLYVENEPEFIYYKTLYHVFEKFLDDQSKGGLLNEKIGFFESEIWNMLYDFQKDGVKGAINKILNFNGCILADSVGLGKTFEALAVIRYFELLNNRVLVLCPKKLSSNWTVYQASKNSTLNPFVKDRFNYHVLYHTDLGRVKGYSDADSQDLSNFNWGAYDLVVIDESHNFRGNPGDKEKRDGTKRMNRAKWLMEKIIKSGSKTKILLLSATPVNNNLRDLRNQIFLITEGRNEALFESTQIRDISQTLKQAQTQFTIWADHKKNKVRNQKSLVERLGTDFTKLLDTLTIARSRKHILKFYDESRIGKFPNRLKPIPIYANIDLKDRFFTFDALNKKILKYKLSVFNPSAYVKSGLENKYEEMAKNEILAFKQRDRENFLIGMMKVNFLKRLESSIESFEISLDKTIKKIENLIDKIEGFKKNKVKSQELDLGGVAPDDDEMDEMNVDNEEWQVGKKLKFDLADLELDNWLKDLADDKEALIELYNTAVAVSVDRDAKLKELKDLISNKVKNPLNDNNRKVVVFTAFADTAQYIHDSIKEYVRKDLKLHIAMVVGTKTETSFGTNQFLDILTNFSPISKQRKLMRGMPQNEEIDILIATDCISEGQNLQDCDYMINYDIHWNPVRIIQRFGRIDRLGSKNSAIQLVNFWPTKDLDNYINLKERVEARMALVDVTATGEDNILNTEQIEELITDDLKYRNQQLKRLKDEILDLEDMNETISLTDFTLDDFRIDLLNYLNANRTKLENAPYGLYAVVPALSGSDINALQLELFTESQKEIIKPGVIFCLKQKDGVPESEEINPLQPYFLLYIRDDGNVRFNYVHAKQIFEMFRLLCQGKSEAFNSLCEIFNQETENGKNMTLYNKLLQRAISEINTLFRKRNFQQLTAKRGAVLVPEKKQAKDDNHFELITWLVIK